MTARTHTRTAALRGAWILAGLLTAPLLAGSAWAQAAPEITRCPATPFGDPLTGPMWNGWGGDTTNTRFQPAAAAGLTAADVPRLALKWAMGFPSGEFVSSQQTVVGGRIYIGTGPGGAMSLDAATGCVHWTFRAHAIVRTAITIGRVSGSTPPRYTAFFADLQANVYAIDAETGVHLWTKKADLHPQARITGAPTFYEGRLYVPVSSLEEAAAGSPTYECCTFRGNVVAYDAVTGQEVWRTYIIDEKPVPTKKNARGVQQWGPAGAAVWNAPTIDAKRGVLYVATGDAYTSPAADSTDSVVAMDLKTGKKVWVKQLTANDVWITGCADSRPTNPSINCPGAGQLGPDFDFAQSAILRPLPNGRTVLAIGQKSGVGWALDPDKKGAIVWQNEVGIGSIRGGMLFGSAADEQQVYFATSDTPHGAERAGGIAAVNLATGRRAWYVRPPAMKCDKPDDPRCIQGQSAAVTAIPGVVFSGATNGIMRAYSTTDGKVIWEHDTARDYQTLNGFKAKGGVIDGPGPTVVNGVVYLNSGYSTTRGGVPGNVMLAFSVPKL